MTADLALAEFIDRCCQRYARHTSYRRKLENERPNNITKTKRTA